jgi:hypothetical protein
VINRGNPAGTGLFLSHEVMNAKTTTIILANARTGVSA